MPLIPYNQLSNEQKDVIRRIAGEMDGLFVEGPPGSGKTLISLYVLRDMVANANMRPLVLMFNHSLYGYLSAALQELGIEDNLTIATKDKFFWDMRIRYNIHVPDSDDYDTKYGYILDNLLKQDIPRRYPVVVVDEVQDLRPQEWELIKRLSERILTLGDFNQSVYQTSFARSELVSGGRHERLTKIYRFHKNIAKLAVPFSRDGEDLVSKVARDSSTQPTLIDVDRRHEFDKIAEILGQIKSYNKRIGVICPVKSRLEELSSHLNSCGITHSFYTVNKELRAHDFSTPDPLLLTGSSSKGLEFEHVILFGFDRSNSRNAEFARSSKIRDLIYVGITRTNDNLYVIRTEETIEEIKNIQVETEEEVDEFDIDDLF